jgi:hypothetical protein
MAQLPLAYPLLAQRSNTHWNSKQKGCSSPEQPLPYLPTYTIPQFQHPAICTSPDATDNPARHFAFYSPILPFMFGIPQVRLCDYTICCKGCRQNVPAPVGTMPDTWIAAKCPLCGEKRRYLPSEIFRGRLSTNLGPKPVRSAGWR